VSNEPFTQYLTNQLEEIERAWSLESARFQQIRLAIQSEINLAESLISEAEHPVNLLIPNPEHDLVRHRFLNALDTAELYLTNARYELQTATAHRSECARLKGLKKVNQGRQRCKAIAQANAQKLWEADRDQKIRLGDMCDQVWSSLFSKYREDLPDKPDGLKPWLRQVAPSYAVKPGRPKKK
jgi:hypothetical protein